MRSPAPGRVVQAAGWLAGWWLLWRLPAPAEAAPRRPAPAEAAPRRPAPAEAAPRRPAPAEAAPRRPAPAEAAPRPDPVGGWSVTAADHASLSVIIPARDEERSLPFLLRSLASQTAPPLEVIVVDDHSGDDTAARAGAAGARVVSSDPLPDGWTGKTWACHQGAAVARGEVLCFLDADVTLAPQALACLQGEHARRGGLVSVQPFHATEETYESLSAVCNLVELMGTGAFTAAPRRPATMAFGPCLLLSRADYQRIGGHAHPAVRGLVAEDIGLARRAAGEGLAITAFAGRRLVAFRMYPGGPRQLAEGWTKMLAYGARYTPVPLALAVGGWVTGALLGATSLVPRRGCRGPAMATRVLTYAAWTSQLWWMLRRVGRFGWPAVVAWPLPLAVFIGLFGRSVAVRATGRQPRWRGRSTPAV